MKYFVLAGLVSLAAESLATPPLYVVRESATGKSELIVTLSLPRGDGQPRKLVTRAPLLGLNAQVQSPRCGKRALRQDNAGAWVVPNQCVEVVWTVRAKLVPNAGADVSQQATLRFSNPSWFLFSEPASLLRLQSDNGPSTITLKTTSPESSGLGATQVADGVWRIPSLNNAPEFFALGRLSSTTRNIGRFRVKYVADNRARVDRLNLESMHERALHFLARVLPPSAAAPLVDLDLLIMWVGIHEKIGRAGGSAGNRSFVANYVFGRPENESVNAARTLAILAHEQFHQLVDLVRGELSPLPIWLNESLAHYYGLKALQHAAPSSSANLVRARFIDPLRPISVGLLELNRRHATNDSTAYPLFYEQGATFWSEIDSAMSSTTNGAASLDELVSELLRSEIPEGGQLPESFVDKLRERIGEKTDALILAYVGN